MQTMLNSTLRKYALSVEALEQHSVSEILTLPDAIRLQIVRTLPKPTTPAAASATQNRARIIILHGWLGNAQSGYVQSAAKSFWEAGYEVIRLNLRDHGDSAHLNEEMFHSARTKEVVDAVQLLAGNRTALLGYSLGGNFALRVAQALGIPTLAVCPVIQPAPTMERIDNGFIVYRKYFVNKWRRALLAKQQAFPKRYNFADALSLSSVSALTDYFLHRHTTFTDAADYFSGYDLSEDYLAGTHATILTAEDDPVIPIHTFDGLPSTISIERRGWGGHCAFLANWRFEPWADAFALDHFNQTIL